MSVVLGVDIGGSHITVALVDLHKRSVVAGSGKRKLVNARGSASQIVDAWCEVITAVFTGMPAESRRIGIAMPGPFNYEEGISLIEDQDKFRSLYKMNIKLLLAERLGMAAESIRFVNDAAGFLQGEVFCGAARHYRRVLGFTLGTGLGSALYKEGVAMDADLWKTSFLNGIAEDYLSTRWFTGRYAELNGESISGVKEILEENDQAIIKQLFLEFSENLGAFLLPQLSHFKAEAVVFGGNISNAHAHFLPALEQFFKNRQIKIVLKKAELNEDASLLGAASCWDIDK
jgi:glucokinase